MNVGQLEAALAKIEDKMQEVLFRDYSKWVTSYYQVNDVFPDRPDVTYSKTVDGYHWQDATETVTILD